MLTLSLIFMALNAQKALLSLSVVHAAKLDVWGFALNDLGAAALFLIVFLLVGMGVLVGLLARSQRKIRAIEAERELLESPTAASLAQQRNYGWEWWIKEDLISVNREVYAMFGSADLIELPAVSNWKQYVHPDDLGRVEASLESLFLGQIAHFSQAFRIRTWAGLWQGVLVHGTVMVWGTEHEPLRMAGAFSLADDMHPFETVVQSLLQIALVKQDGFFDHLLLELTNLFAVRSAFISQRVDTAGLQARMITQCQDGNILGSCEYSLISTPCAGVFAGQSKAYADEVNQLFPDVAYLASVNARSYIGVPLTVRGEVLGVLAMVDDQALIQPEQTLKMLSVFAGCASVGMERILAEKVLKTSEQRWQFALEGTGDGVWDWDIEHQIVKYSAAFQRMLGYGDDELDERVESWMSRLHPDDLAPVMAEFDLHLSGAIDAISVEYRIKCKNGYFKWILGRGKVLQRKEDGTPLRLVGTHTDITLRKASEQALQDTMAKYQSLFSAMTEGFAFHQLLLDENGNPFDYILLDVNPAFSAMVGIAMEKLIGSRGSVLFRDGKPFGLEEFAQVALTGKPERIEVFHPAIDRFLSITVFSPEKGRFAAVYTDISQRKQAEAALAAERNLLRTLVDNLPDAVYVKDINYRKTLSNKADVSNSGFRTEADLLGKTDFELWPRELATRFYEHDRYVIERGLPLVRQEELISPPGKSPRWILTAKIPLMDPDGRVSGLVGIGREITESKLAVQEINRLNAELEQRVKERTSQLEAVVSELEAFSYSVSHDLRAPLRSMEGFSSALLEDYGSMLDENGRRYLNRIQNAAQRMSQLIDDLLKLSRITRTDLHRSEVNLSEIAVGVAADLSAGEAGRMVEWAIQPGIFVNGDANLLRIVMVNLLGNAWKFTAKHATARIEVNVTEKMGHPVYFVRDDGAGFEMAYAGKLFGPFQRMHKAADFEGSGIGLATVQRVIRRHGGSVWAESEVERGTTIYFTLV